MNRSIRRTALMCALLFAALLLNANWVQFIDSDRYTESTYNPRQLVEEYKTERGKITAGETLAESKATSDGKYKYRRVYAERDKGMEYAPVVGFQSIQNSARGIERKERAVLAGTDDRLFTTHLIDMFTGKPRKGSNVLLTINPKAQDAAWEAIRSTRSKKGSIVAIEPKTGKILAMVSTPSYDPNALTTHDPKKYAAAFRALDQDPDKPLLNRAVTHALPPGSTFKILTAAAALDSGKFSADSRLPGNSSLDLPDTDRNLPNEGGRSCGDGGGDGRTSFANALRQSCNVAFGDVGLKLGQETLLNYAKQFGFNTKHQVLPEELASRFPAGNYGKPFPAYWAIGQHDVRATPLQMAMVTAAIANRGLPMKPQLVAGIQAPNTTTVERIDPEPLPHAVTEQVAETVTDWMVGVVKDGTGQNAQIPGIEVAGKTGTAQQGNRLPLAWFVSFAPANDPQVAVAVVVEDAAESRSDIGGGKIAAPLAKKVMEAVLQR